MGARLLPAFALIGLAACSGGSDLRAADPRDPFEPFNRAMFAFNLDTDDIVLEPAAKGYRKLPGGIQRATTNFADWTSYPSTAVNSTLQGKFENAALASIHFLVNGLTLGLADLTEDDDNPEDEDFGQTLAAWRAPEGPYVVLPFLASGTVRSHVGSVVDSFTDPLGRSGEPAARTIQYTSIGAGILSFRGNNFEAINDVKYNAPDPYARTRSIYYQFRDGQLLDGDPSRPSSADEEFNSFLEGEEDL